MSDHRKLVTEIEPFAIRAVKELGNEARSVAVARKIRSYPDYPKKHLEGYPVNIFVTLADLSKREVLIATPTLVDGGKETDLYRCATI